jgi:hypothetical protein
LKDFLDEIAASYNSGVFAPALHAALSVPETLGRIERPELAPHQAFDAWYDSRVGGRHGPAPGFGGVLVRAIRAALVEGQAGRFEPFGFGRVAFYVPVGDDLLLDGVVTHGGTRLLQLRLDSFINAILNAAIAHLEELGDSPAVTDLLQVRFEMVEIPAGRALIR